MMRLEKHALKALWEDVWCSDSGFITNGTFNKLLQILMDKTRPTGAGLVLLILHNHSILKNMEALNLTQEKMLLWLASFLPSYISHKLQQLDESVHCSLKVTLQQTTDTFQKNHLGRRFTQHQMHH